MKKIISITISIVLSITMLLSVIPASAGYLLSSLINNASRSSWMSAIEDNTLLSDISMPGTHDSAARIVDTMTGTWAQTQSLTITEQLEAGVRFLDLRIRYNTDVYYNVELCHGSISVWNGRGGHLTLYEVLGDVHDFLTSHPTESVMVSFKEDDGSNEYNIVNSIEQIKALDSSYWYQSYTIPKLGDVRGKMVVATRMSSMRGIDMYWNNQSSDGSYVQTSTHAIVQDRYNMGADKKWSDAVVPTFNLNKPSGTWVVNSLNTTGGGIAGVSANADTMNNYFRRHELSNNKCYGIVMFDYINDDFTSKIIKCNDLVSKRQPNSENGQYYYRLNVHNPDSVPSGWSSVSLRLYYKGNNGTGYEGSQLIFQNGDTYNGYAYVCQTGNYEFSGVLNGYPSQVVFQYDWGYGSDRLELDFDLYVSNSPTGTQTKVLDTMFARTSGISSPQKGTDYFLVNSSSYPSPSSVKFVDSSATSINAPAYDSSVTNSVSLDARVYDQYNVKWYQAPTCSTTASVSGVSFSGTTMSVNKDANNNANGTTVPVKAQFNSLVSSQTKNVVLNTNKIPYTFVDLEGNVLDSGMAYAGDVPEFNGEEPTRPSSSSFHYVFSGWAPKKFDMSNNQFKPVYDVSSHSVSRTVTGPDATCTEDGYDVQYCDCGYSWHTVKSATGHNIITQYKASSCEEDGYNYIHCDKCDYVIANDILTATGHDYDNAYRGKHIDPVNGENGYYPYFCPICDEELVDLRVYDNNDWSVYYEACNYYSYILKDSDYSSYDTSARENLESALNAAVLVEDREDALQYDIDIASSTILDAIESFCDDVGVVYHTVTFVRADNTIINTYYKNGTIAEDISLPENSDHLVSEDTHTVFRWEKIYPVTENASYRELGTESKHTYNTFIKPTETFAPTCTEQGRTVYTCLCGYSYNEIIPATDHDYAIYTPNYDGTHKVVCKYDPSHYIVEQCDTDNQDGVCPLCSFELDYSAYDEALSAAFECKANPDKYDIEAYIQLVDSIAYAQDNIDSTKSQIEINNLTNILLSAISDLKINEYNVRIVYIRDDEVLDISDGIMQYDDIFYAPTQDYYKVTIEINDVVSRLIESSYAVHSDCEIIVYYN